MVINDVTMQEEQEFADVFISPSCTALPPAETEGQRMNGQLPAEVAPAQAQRTQPNAGNGSRPGWDQGTVTPSARKGGNDGSHLEAS